MLLTPISIPQRPAVSKLPSPEISPQNYAFFQDFIKRESGIVLDADKRYLLEARLMPLTLKHRLYSLNELCDRLQTNSDAALRQEVVEALTTHETFFFREPVQYEALRTTVIPELVDKRASRRIRIWSAAASSGQEAYSTAMLLLEMGLGHWTVSIVATDLSNAVLSRAAAGKYSQIEVNRGLPAQLLVKYFQREGLNWQLKDEVRRMVQFQQDDLRRPGPAQEQFDVVFCRNVLIYFNNETKRQVLDRIWRSLAPGGHLLLGGSETTLNLDDRFTRRQLANTVFYQAPQKG